MTIPNEFAPTVPTTALSLEKSLKKCTKKMARLIEEEVQYTILVAQDPDRWAHYLQRTREELVFTHTLCVHYTREIEHS